MSTQKIATSTLWQILSQGVTTILGIASVKLVTLALSPTLFGNYQTVYSYLQIFGILADFGLYAVAVRELGRAAHRSVALVALFLLRACITVLSLGVAVALSFILFAGTPLPSGIAIASFVPFFILLGGMFRAAFQVEYRMREVFVAEIFSKLIPVLLIFAVFLSGVRQSSQSVFYHLFLIFGSLGGLSFFLITLYFASGLELFGQSLSVVFLRRRTEVFQEFFRFAKFSIPYGLAFLMTTIYRQSDVTLIAILRPQDYALQNAFYGVAMSLVSVGYLLPTFIMNSVLPSVADDTAPLRNPLFLGKILVSLLVLGSVFSLTAFFWSRPLILLLSHPSYLSNSFDFGADTALMLLSIPMFLSVLITYFFYLLLMVHAWRPLLRATSVAALLSVLLNVLLIPSYGFVGASLSSILTHLMLATSLASLTIRRVSFQLRFSQIATWFAFSFSFALFLFFTAPLLRNEYLTIFFGCIALLLALVLAKLFRLLPELHFLTE